MLRIVSVPDVIMWRHVFGSIMMSWFVRTAARMRKINSITLMMSLLTCISGRIGMNKSFLGYIKACTAAGVNFPNVRNIAAHWLYGTSPASLAKLSVAGIVYSP
jgi:hypothetical protein